MRRQIIEENFDPELFTNYLIENREDGGDVDNWNYEELETMVEFYKREIRRQQQSLDLYYKLEDMELFDEKTNLYCRREKAPRRNPTIFSKSRQTVQVKKIGAVESGIIFSAKSIVARIFVFPLNKEVVRTEEEFKWLADTLLREFPQTPIPPLVRANPKVLDDDSLNDFRIYFEKFLSELVAHSDLKFSKALEVFCTCQSKEEFDSARKQVESYINRSIFIERNLSKKKFEGLKSDVIKMFPMAKEEITYKISNQIRDHLRISEEKFRRFEGCLDRIEALSAEYEKVFLKLMKLNRKHHDAVFDMMKISAEMNAKKETKYMACYMEEVMLGSVVSFLAQQGGLNRTNSERRS